MHKLLIVDDDEGMRRLIKLRLSAQYEIIETGQPEQVVELALVHKPAAILTDLRMPGFSGLDLCASLHDLSYTGRIPIFVVSGGAGERYREKCERVGAIEYFQKPVDFKRLEQRLRQELEKRGTERRSSVRVRMSVLLRLTGVDARGTPFDEVTRTENVSLDGFLCLCAATLAKESLVKVFLPAAVEKYAGRARVVRSEPVNTAASKYGFQFQEKTRDWIVKPQSQGGMFSALKGEKSQL